MLENAAESHTSGARFVGRRCMPMRVFFHLSATIYNMQYKICLFTILFDNPCFIHLFLGKILSLNISFLQFGQVNVSPAIGISFVLIVFLQYGQLKVVILPMPPEVSEIALVNLLSPANIDIIPTGSKHQELPTLWSNLPVTI